MTNAQTIKNELKKIDKKVSVVTAGKGTTCGWVIVYTDLDRQIVRSKILELQKAGAIDLRYDMENGKKLFCLSVNNF
mgnify:CR=1 FL=1